MNQTREWARFASSEERSEFQRLMRRVDEGGNDGADIYDVQVFEEHMMEKYASQIAISRATHESAHRQTNPS